MKAILIGRHAPQMGQDIKIIEQRAVTFPATAAECRPVIESMMAEAATQGAALLFQNTPGQVAAALTQIVGETAYETGVSAASGWYAGANNTRVGVIISVPGPRPGKVRKVYPVYFDDYYEFEAAVKLANPRASVGFASYDEPDVNGNVGYSTNIQPVFVEVDGPPMPFVFSHIEWLL